MEYIDKIEELFKAPLIKIDQDYDLRFSTIRVMETSFVNFLTQLISNYTGFDFTLLQSGHIRADKVLTRGSILNKKAVYQIVPIIDCICGTLIYYSKKTRN